MSSSEQRTTDSYPLHTVALQDPFCLSIPLTEASSDLPELIFYNRPEKLCQQFITKARAADFSMSGL